MMGEFCYASLWCIVFGDCGQIAVTETAMKWGIIVTFKKYSILFVLFVWDTIGFNGALYACAREVNVWENALTAGVLLLVLARSETRTLQFLIIIDLCRRQWRIRSRWTTKWTWRCLECLDGGPANITLNLPPILILSFGLFHLILHVYHFYVCICIYFLF